MLQLVVLLGISLLKSVHSDLGLISWGALTAENTTAAGNVLYAGDVSLPTSNRSFRTNVFFAICVLGNYRGLNRLCSGQVQVYTSLVRLVSKHGYNIKTTCPLIFKVVASTQNFPLERKKLVKKNVQPVRQPERGPGKNPLPWEASRDIHTLALELC
jgi:hypothetical protein